VTTALLCVAGAALCSGAATVLQALAARREPVQPTLDAGLLWRLARSRTYLAALALVVLGFVLSFVALQTLPLFLVQAGRASSLGVAAVLAALVLGARLRRAEVGALAGIAAGLVVLGASVAPRAAGEVGAATGWGLLAAVGLVAAGAALAVRSPRPRRAGLALAALAAAGFAVLAVGARTLGPIGPALLADPGLWAMGAGGGLGLLLGALALQRAPVVAVTSVMVGVETCLGAFAGMLLAGDRPSAGSTGPTAVAFAVVLVGVLLVARFGSPDGFTRAAPRDGVDAGSGPG
jgi:drug/metabolite transporter (DMT)-like permease